MTRIDFYQIETDEPVLVFACRLIEKVYRLGHQVYVHTRNEEESESLDDLLWSFREDRFIPHSCQHTDNTPDASVPPVLIGHEPAPGDHHEVLVNLCGDVPEFFSRFERVAEVVPFDKSSRDAARRNYKFYQDRGYPLNYHSMK